jgi:hypothetical protein
VRIPNTEKFDKNKSIIPMSNLAFNFEITFVVENGVITAIK